MAILNYGTLSEYRALTTKDSNALYFLNNHQVYKGDELISNVRTVDSFQDESTLKESDKLNYFINITTGEIRYVTEEGDEKTPKYLDLTKLALSSITVTVNELKTFIDSLTTKDITTSTLTVDDHTLVVTTETISNVLTNN